MTDTFDCTLVVCDMARVVDNRLDVLGGGLRNWVAGSPLALGIILLIPWGEANRDQVMRVTLEDDDGHPVVVPRPSGEPAPWECEARFRAGRPPHAMEGEQLPFAWPINTFGLPLVPGRRYSFVVRINDGPTWRRSFNARPRGVARGAT